MKCKEERCKCGQDLTGIEVEPAMWTVVGGERMPFVECPRCRRYCILVEPEPEPAPTARGGRRRPEPEPAPEPEPVAEPEE